MSGSRTPHQADPALRRRLRWRARRGKLENDLIMERFFERHESSLTDDDVEGLDALLDLPDDELLDLILDRRQLDPKDATPQAQRVLRLLRDV